MDTITEQTKKGLDPLIDQRTEVLILGTFPSDRSLEIQEYYANPRNYFWRIMETVLGEKILGNTYPKRIEILKRHRIGLWDVIASCKRDGSSDNKIRDPKPNDFSRLRQEAPNLRLICFNGKAAKKYADKLVGLDYETNFLPSSSPQNTSSKLDDKTRIWHKSLS